MSDDTTTVLAANPSSTSSGGPVKVTFPTGSTNSKQSGPIHVNTNNIDSGQVFLTNDLVTFEIENNRGGNVRCDFEIDDDQQAGVVLAVGSLVWDAEDTSTKYIQFESFPLRADQSTAMGSCNYKLILTNLADSNQGTEVWENIY